MRSSAKMVHAPDSIEVSFAQLMKKAGRNPSRQDVVNALEKGQLDQGPGLVPFGFSSSNHLGYQGVRMAVIQDGAAQYTGAVYTAATSGSVTPCSGCASKTMPANGMP